MLTFLTSINICIKELLITLREIRERKLITLREIKEIKKLKKIKKIKTIVTLSLTILKRKENIAKR